MIAVNVTTTEWTTAVSAVAAAIAAIAAWAAVAQASRWQRRQREPLLNIQASAVIDLGFVRVRVENTGGGFARECRIWVREGAQCCLTGLPPHGSLGPGAGVTLRTGLVPQPAPSEAVVICRYGKRLLAWDAVGRHKRWRLNSWAVWRPDSDRELVDRFYPHTPSIDELQLASYAVES